MARAAARRMLLAPITDVWAFVSEPYNLADWWPGISGVEPDRRGFAAGARWIVLGPELPGYLRRPQAPGTLIVTAVAACERFAFQLPRDRLSADLRLRATDERRTEAELTTDGPLLLAFRGSLPARALARLHALLRTGEEI